VLATEGLNPGTVVIDAAWQLREALAESDTAKWPDLRSWIARAHAAGRRVLLWWNAWAVDGLPIQETVRGRAGESLEAEDHSLIRTAWAEALL
jgi:hypothetical protein